MKLSISNIAWPGKWDRAVYAKMEELGYEGLEIAPTRVLPEAPYDRLEEAARWRAGIPFAVPSMQSIWFGRSENLFRSGEEREALFAYTRKAVAFAETLGCGNLVFGCPRNRSMEADSREEDALAFFRRMGDYAAEHGVVIAMEANPPIYNTNFLNTTGAAADFVRRVGSRGLKLNLDLGTMIENGETAAEIGEYLDLVNHIHISEPMLAPIRERALHREIGKLVRERGYTGFVSIEMRQQDTPEGVFDALAYVRDAVGAEASAQSRAPEAP